MWHRLQEDDSTYSVTVVKRKTEKELLRQQLELLAEKSKSTCPASNELSQNSFAMVRISNELLKRKYLAFMFAFAFCYFIKCFTIHRK